MTSLPLLLIVASSPQAADVTVTGVATEPQVLRLPNDADLTALDKNTMCVFMCPILI